ncbi:MAG: hypothetical protein UW86_C0005G0018 [Microgenomates group bacterium GW2011_GWA1_Microgenomates_45_10]|nr:MAG: hypothetical protein UW69_C0005G0018 [Microgenomates group bacterium GW2011_GWA2_44_7]KKT77608.1 MAG: hypothetical protein UW73_C0016G0018 [Microgenomates group bacterium GW2011_GWB1_44_8]KKT87277.1 MAG: hypothetical protein UW86_C0005G0018 [Microgenomates group bacterium GW2011_GWA1_Microgenomates_45_10]
MPEALDLQLNDQDVENLSRQAMACQTAMLDFFHQGFDFRVARLPRMWDQARLMTEVHLNLLPEASTLNPMLSEALGKILSTGWMTMKEGKRDKPKYFPQPWVGTYSEIILNTDGLILAHMQNLDAAIRSNFPDLTGPVLVKAIEGLHVLLAVQEGRLPPVESINDLPAKKHLEAVLDRRIFACSINRLIILPKAMVGKFPQAAGGIFITSNGARFHPDYVRHTRDVGADMPVDTWEKGGAADMIMAEYLSLVLANPDVKVPPIIQDPDAGIYLRGTN